MMGYYDNVKDSVEDEDSRDKANFESLRQAAEETSEEEKEGDDTDIEVLEEGISKDAPGKTQKEKQKQQQQETGDAGGKSGSEGLMPSSGSSDAQDSSKQSSTGSTGSSLTTGSGSGSSSSPGSGMGSGSTSTSGSTASGPVSGDMESIEEKLDRIIEQNDRMIRILESFGS